MKVQQFLLHHEIKENPFGQEDAQTDPVFKHRCLAGTYHPAWDKIYGSPLEPATSVVFGEKGSGKTALRLQIVDHLERHNRAHADRRVFIIEYDDFTPFLDCFRERLRFANWRPERALEQWRLWDHIDAILSLGTTRLVEAIVNAKPSGEPTDPAVPLKPDDIGRLSRLQKRDLLLLAAFYDHTHAMPKMQRWHLLRRKLRYSALLGQWDRGLGVLVTLVAFAGLVYFWNRDTMSTRTPWVICLLGLLAGWGPWLWRNARLMWRAWQVSRQVRVIEYLRNTLRRILAAIPAGELAGQPMPSRDRSDDRYELLTKLQAVLRTLGFPGIMVLVDRVDEPHLINGSADRMRDFLWPMFDNKFLKHPGIGFKLLLPIEVSFHLAREDKEFYERSRFDKQNLIRSLEWTGQSLYDVANDRIRACAVSETAQPKFRDLFDDSITDAELIATLDRLRVPRHLFKFTHRLLVEHCNRFTEDQPSWKISRETLQSVFSLYQRDLEAFDRGMGTG
jgi:hypothetical protein